MSQTINVKALRKLSVDEKLAFIDELCESIEELDVQLTPTVLSEMKRRLAAGRADRNANLTIDQLKALNAGRA